MDTIHMTKSEVAADFGAALEKIRQGVEIVVEQDSKPLARITAVLDAAIGDAAARPGYRQSELRWLREHTATHGGLWVLLDGDHMLASATDASEVFAEARRRNIRRPFVARVERADELPFGGW